MRCTGHGIDESRPGNLQRGRRLLGTSIPLLEMKDVLVDEDTELILEYSLLTDEEGQLGAMAGQCRDDLSVVERRFSNIRFAPDHQDDPCSVRTNSPEFP